MQHFGTVRDRKKSRLNLGQATQIDQLLENLQRCFAVHWNRILDAGHQAHQLAASEQRFFFDMGQINRRSFHQFDQFICAQTIREIVKGFNVIKDIFAAFQPVGIVVPEDICDGGFFAGGGMNALFRYQNKRCNLLLRDVGGGA